jgi:hypothetical protein
VNWGTDPHLGVNPHPSDTARTLVKFDVSGIPTSATVTAATLTVCPTATFPTEVGRVESLFRVVGAWSENAVTWNNQPSVSGTLTASHAVLAGLTCQNYSVAADVQLWVGGTPNHGWQLTNNTPSITAVEVTYGAREHSDPDVRPRLTVSFAP